MASPEQQTRRRFVHFVHCVPFTTLFYPGRQMSHSVRVRYFETDECVLADYLHRRIECKLGPARQQEEQGRHDDYGRRHK
jgi:hypothetical protein